MVSCVVKDQTLTLTRYCLRIPTELFLHHIAQLPGRMGLFVQRTVAFRFLTFSPPQCLRGESSLLRCGDLERIIRCVALRDAAVIHQNLLGKPGHLDANRRLALRAHFDSLRDLTMR